MQDENDSILKRMKDKGEVIDDITLKMIASDDHVFCCSYCSVKNEKLNCYSWMDEDTVTLYTLLFCQKCTLQAIKEEIYTSPFFRVGNAIFLSLSKVAWIEFIISAIKNKRQNSRFIEYLKTLNPS